MCKEEYLVLYFILCVLTFIKFKGNGMTYRQL